MAIKKRWGNTPTRCLTVCLKTRERKLSLDVPQSHTTYAKQKPAQSSVGLATWTALAGTE